MPMLKNNKIQLVSITGTPEQRRCGDVVCNMHTELQGTHGMQSIYALSPSLLFGFKVGMPFANPSKQFVYQDGIEHV